MKYMNKGDLVMLRIDKGEEIMEKIQEVLEKENIDSAYLSGIGAVSHCILKYYDPVEKTYGEKIFSEQLEITSLIGNVAMMDGKRIIHAHINLGDTECNIKGGHLDEARVGGTCEILLKRLDMDLKRGHDPETNLNILQL